MRDSKATLADFARDFADRLLPFLADEDIEILRLECFRGGLRQLETVLLEAQTERLPSDSLDASFVTFESLFDADRSLSVLTTQSSIRGLEMRENGPKAFRTRTLSSIPKTDSFTTDKCGSQSETQVNGPFADWYRAARESVDGKRQPRLDLFLAKIEPIVECPMRFHKRFVVGTRSFPDPSLNWRVFVKAAKQAQLGDPQIAWFALDSLAALHDRLGLSLSAVCKEPGKQLETVARLTAFVASLRADEQRLPTVQQATLRQISEALAFYRRVAEAAQNNSRLRVHYASFPLRKNVFESSGRDFLETLVADFRRFIDLPGAK